MRMKPVPYRAPTSPTALRLFLLLCRWAAGGVLLYAGFMKAIAPAAEFAAVIDAYRIVPAHWAGPLSIGLPWIELWTGTFLIAGFQRRKAAAVAAVLFAVFIAAVGSALLRKIDLVSCGCFGADALNPKYTVMLDAGLFIVSLIAALTAERRPLAALDIFFDKN